MSEISEHKAREAAAEMRRLFDELGPLTPGTFRHVTVSHGLDVATAKLVAFAEQELARRDAERAARQQPITPEWCLANGAFYREPYYVFDDSVRVTVRLIGRSDAWLVMIAGCMLDWSAECVGQIEELRKALRGDKT